MDLERSGLIVDLSQVVLARRNRLDAMARFRPVRPRIFGYLPFLACCGGSDFFKGQLLARPVTGPLHRKHRRGFLAAAGIAGLTSMNFGGTTSIPKHRHPFDGGRRLAADSTQRWRCHSFLGVRSTAPSRHLTDLAERPQLSLTIGTLFGRRTSRGCTPHPMTLHALPERMVTAHVGCNAARRGQSDQCTAAWDSRFLGHSSNELRSRRHSIETREKTAGGNTPAANFYGERYGSHNHSPPAQRFVPSHPDSSPWVHPLVCEGW